MRTPPIARAVGGGCPFTWASTVPGEVFRDVDGRVTKRVSIEGKSYFVKTYGAHGRMARLRAALTPSASLVLDARGEARALAALEQAGVPVPKLVAWDAEQHLPFRSFIVTEDIGTQRTIGHSIEELRGLPTHSRRALIEAVAEMVSRMHDVGINHRACYLVHFAILGDWPRSSAPLRLCLMDLHRAQARSKVPLRWRAKDLGGLLFSAEAAALTRAERLRFVRAYARVDRLRDALGDPVWRRATSRATALFRERKRRGKRFGR